MTVAVAPASLAAAALRVERRPLEDLTNIAPAWRVLAERAVEPNVFYEPAFALAAAPVFGRGVSAGLVWLSDKLIGLFPARTTRRYGIPPAVLEGWTHPFAPLGTPLIDCDDGPIALGAWLDYLAHDSPALWLLPFLSKGAFARVLDAALAMRGLSSVPFGTHERAMLAPANRRDYLVHSVGARKRKELHRQRRRLEERGQVTAEVAVNAASVERALDDFIALEAGGWKGRAGTAIAQRAELQRFVQRAARDLAAEDKARLDVLRVGSSPIAAILTLRSGASAWTWKIAYDENHAHASPGVQLMHDLTEALLADRTIVRVDSCATADHPLVDHLWRERLGIHDRLIAVKPAPAAFAVARALEETRRAGIVAAKSLRDRLRPI